MEQKDWAGAGKWGRNRFLWEAPADAEWNPVKTPSYALCRRAASSKHPESSPPFLEVFGGPVGELSKLPFPVPRMRTPNVSQPYCPSWETILEKRGRRKNIEKNLFSQPLNSTFCYFILWDQVDLVVVVFVLFFSPWKGSVFILAGVFHLDYL